MQKGQPKGYPWFTPVRSVPDGRDKIKAVREKTAAGEERLRGGAAWSTARRLAGEDKPDESDHHLTRGRYQKKEEDEASSPSSKMEAKSGCGWRGCERQTATTCAQRHHKMGKIEPRKGARDVHGVNEKLFR